MVLMSTNRSQKDKPTYILNLLKYPKISGKPYTEKKLMLTFLSLQFRSPCSNRAQQCAARVQSVCIKTSSNKYNKVLLVIYYNTFIYQPQQYGLITCVIYY